jgi:hypothetical protein
MSDVTAVAVLGIDGTAQAHAGSFDYDHRGFEVQETAELRAAAQRIRGHLSRSAFDMITAGFELRRIRDDLLQPREFAPWVREELQFSRSTAYRLIACADLADRAARICPKLGQIHPLSAGAFLELAAKSVPDELLEGVLSGEVASTPAAVREALAKHRGEPSRRGPHACPTVGELLEEMSDEERIDTVLDAFERFEGKASEAAALLLRRANRRYRGSAAGRLQTFAQAFAVAAVHAKGAA